MSATETLTRPSLAKSTTPKLPVDRKPTLKYRDPIAESFAKRSDYTRTSALVVDTRLNNILRLQLSNGGRPLPNTVDTTLIKWIEHFDEGTQASEIRWQRSQTSLQILRSRWLKVGSVVGESISVALPEHSTIEFQEDWKFSPEGILQRVENPSTCWEDQLTAVLIAETMAFDKSLKSRLLRCLYRFCEDHRFSAEVDTVTAVGAAIRKYAMNMDEDTFDDYAKLLIPSDTATLSHEIELELVKAVGWRLAYEPWETGGKQQVLLSILVDLCRGYLTRRLILQRNYASTVLHGIVAVAILESATGEFVNTHSLIETGRELRVAWFYELLSDRLADAIASLEEHRPDLAKQLQNEVAFTA